MTTRARYLVAAMRGFVLIFGTASLWLGRDGMNPDGVAYLDASDVYLAGGWPASQTGYWSPLYPTLLALARLLGGTDAVRELATAQVVNLLVFVGAFAALEFLIRSVRVVALARDPDAPPNDVAWRVLVYALFAVVTIGWIRVWLLTPDMIVAAMVFLTGGICVRLAAGRGGWWGPALLGAALGLGYLAKAALLPVGVAVLATLAVALRQRADRRWALKVAAAAVVFVAVAAPQVAYASRLANRLTFSDVGRLSYLWFIADVPGPVTSAFPLPARLPPRDGGEHTLAKLEPPRDPGPMVYDIEAPIPGTLPVWYDAGHWYRDVVAPLYPLRIARAVVRHVRVYIEILGLLLVGGLAAALAAPVTRRDLAALQPAWVLVVPAVAACVMYALILVQTRYVAPFVLLLVAGLVPPWAADALSRRLRTGFLVAALAGLPSAVHQSRVDAQIWGGTASARATLVAALESHGVGPGTRLGFIGEAYDAHWARLGRMRFVTLIPRAEAPRFWQLSEADRLAVLDRMTGAGAQAILAEAPAAGVSADGWERLPSPGATGPELLLYRGPHGVARR